MRGQNSLASTRRTGEEHSPSSDDCDDADNHEPLLLNYYHSDDSGQDNNTDEDDDSGPSSQEEEEPSVSESTVAQMHYASTAAMCLCTFTHSWLLVSVFPYSGFMVIKLIRGTNEENAGFYAGILSAAFMIGRTITSYFWGKISDTYGRRIVITFSLLLSALFSILFGLSTSFATAFLWRFLLGASNGVAGISKAVVSETARGNDTLETRGMSMAMGMWAWGFLFSPALSGFLSDPLRQYPHLVDRLSRDGPVYMFFRKYPFFLPNLVSVVLCLVDIIAVEMWVPETLALEDRRSSKHILKDCYRWIIGIFFRSPKTSDTNRESTVEDGIPLNGLGRDEEIPEEVREARLAHNESVCLLSTSSPHLSPMRGDYITVYRNHTNNNAPEKATMLSIWAKRDTRNHLIVYWVFSFVAIAIDEAFPLFCLSKEGGLGLTENEIGKLLSATGLIFALTQYHVYGWIVDKYGLSKSIHIGALLSTPLVLLIPFSLFFHIPQETDSTTDSNGTSNSSTLSWTAFLYLGILLSACRIFGLVFFSSITIATNRTVIPSHRGTMNGVSMLGGSCAKGLGPMFAGWLTASGISSGAFPPKIGSGVVFAVIGLCGSFTAAMTYTLLETNDDEELDSTINVENFHSFATVDGTKNEASPSTVA